MEPKSGAWIYQSPKQLRNQLKQERAQQNKNVLFIIINYFKQ